VVRALVGLSLGAVYVVRAVVGLALRVAFGVRALAGLALRVALAVRALAGLALRVALAVRSSVRLRRDWGLGRLRLRRTLVPRLVSRLRLLVRQAAPVESVLVCVRPRNRLALLWRAAMSR
jgi:hypothetical protein